MLVSWVLSAVSPVCLFCSLVTCCCWAAMSALTIALVSSPEARPVTWSGEPLPRELRELPVENELALALLELMGCADIAFFYVIGAYLLGLESGWPEATSRTVLAVTVNIT